MVLSPDHPLVEEITAKEQKENVRHYVANTHLKTELERTSLEKEKTGVFTGAYATNPANGEKIPDLDIRLCFNELWYRRYYGRASS